MYPYETQLTTMVFGYPAGTLITIEGPTRIRPGALRARVGLGTPFWVVTNEIGLTPVDMGRQLELFPPEGSA